MSSTLTFHPASHTYYVDSVVVPSVSDVIRSAGLYSYLGSIPQDVLEKARQRGQKVHEAIHKHHALSFDLMTRDRDADAYLEGYQAFLDVTGFEPLYTEQKMWCDCSHSAFAGTCDLIGQLAGNVALIDVKTTSRVHGEAVEWQLSAYRHLAKQCIDEEITKSYVVHIHPKLSLGYSLIPMGTNRIPEFLDALEAM